jgi:hypothetical protein
VKILDSNIVTAFSAVTLGTKVTDERRFRAFLADFVGTHEFAEVDNAEKGVIAGQAFIMLPGAEETVSSGVGKTSQEPSDYVARFHREKVGLYLKRSKAEKATGVAAVVYTRGAYLRDPDILGDAAEAARIEASNATHVLVAVIAFAGPKSPLPAWRFVCNLAGGNLNAQELSGEAIREQAKGIRDYWSTWSVVSD